MSIRTKYYVVQAWLVAHPKAKEWLWFIALWLGGLLIVSTLTYPLKLLINIVK